MTDAPRVLVLGGGMAGLAAAWRLSEPGWRERFSAITVLERGHRLGGKGASSRGRHGRIEEHGLHVWLGYYDNAFRVMRECYAELDRERTDPQCPIRTWRDAFFPAGQLGLFDQGPNGWAPWVATFSSNPLLPGEPGFDGRASSLAELVTRSALLLRDFYDSLDLGASAAPAITLSLSPAPPLAPPRAAFQGIAVTLLAVSQQLLLLAAQGARLLAGDNASAAIDAAFAPLLAHLAPAMRKDSSARRLHDLIDLVRSVLSGMATDGLATDRAAYDAINHLDFCDWLSRHGAQPSTLQSAIVRGSYDLAFSHENGDPSRPKKFAAGWGVFLAAKFFFDYQGSIFWKMRAGMGDVVFAPLYQALVERGVRFQFFSPVEQLVPSADGSGIRSVVIGRSAPREYQPLIAVKGLPCFPAEPDQYRLRDGHQELRCGEDFDLLVFAIPPGMARLVCRPLADQRPEWRDMLDRIATVATHAFQVWLTPDERALGWAHPGTTMSAFAKPFDTWASMSHLIELEDWGDVGPPKTVGYFCSTLPSEAGADTRDHAIRFLDQHARHFWPRAIDPDTRRFRWDLLCADSDVTGADRFDTQYWTANTDPSDQYVQSLPGTDSARLRPDRSGYPNLVLAGDWTDCGINAGCIEAAVVSGLQAANTLLGRPRWDRISGLYLR
ncbi:MAG: FAD-dependent oxidoreductase [Pseudonocardiaceae bacterium]